VNEPVTLPHPSKLMDPIYQGRTVDVINPITSAHEKI